MLRRFPSLFLAAAVVLAAACGPPPVPVSPTTPAELRFAGELRLAPELADLREGRLFLFVREAHEGTLFLNRAYELDDPGFEDLPDGGRRLAFELDEEDVMGGHGTRPSASAHFLIEARLDADGEVLTSDDTVAQVAREVDPGGGLRLVLQAADGETGG